jgi:hypothetical protein
MELVKFTKLVDFTNELVEFTKKLVESMKAVGEFSKNH